MRARRVPALDVPNNAGPYNKAQLNELSPSERVQYKELNQLINLVKKYNKIVEKNALARRFWSKENELKKLFYLQKINELSKFSSDSAVVAWRNQLAENSLENHLKAYGVHQDASSLLQSVEFGNAVLQLSPSAEPFPKTSEKDFAKAMRSRQSLTNTATSENIKTYIQYSQTIVAGYEQNQQIREKARFPELAIPEFNLQVPSEEQKKLLELITKYNEVSGKDADLKKLFYLQKINYVSQYSTDDAVIAWRSRLGTNGLERHLEHYGIHRDSSSLLQSIQFANAVRHFSPAPESFIPAKSDYYKAMQNRDALFTNDNDASENLAEYVRSNQIIIAHYDHDENLQQKIQRSLDFLSLAYGKLDAINQFVHQEFKDLKVKSLGNEEGNNRNFTLSMGETEPVVAVLRVESRDSIGAEQKLHTHPVSEYFSEDSATIMVHFLLETGATEYRPVVISEFVSTGDLVRYAKKTRAQNQHDREEQVVKFIGKISDFCAKLMEAGVYHPDLKLSNFLTDGNRLIVSDRKALGDRPKLLVRDVVSTYEYAPPEYKDHIKLSKGGIAVDFLESAKTAEVDMPSYMSYQLGMALKEFMLRSNIIPVSDEDDFDSKLKNWKLLSKFVESPSDKIKNMAILVQELTRNNPRERLHIEDFNELFNDKNLLSSPEDFMQKLKDLQKKRQAEQKQSEQNYPEKFKYEEDIELIKNALRNQVDQKSEISNKIEMLFEDPRFNLKYLFEGITDENIKKYLENINSVLKEYPDKPDTHMDIATKAYYLLCKNAGLETIPGLDSFKEIVANIESTKVAKPSDSTVATPSADVKEEDDSPVYATNMFSATPSSVTHSQSASVAPAAEDDNPVYATNMFSTMSSSVTPKKSASVAPAAIDIPSIEIPASSAPNKVETKKVEATTIPTQPAKYGFELMSKLPNINAAEANKIYLAANGTYVVRDPQGTVKVGYLLGFDLSNLADRIKDDNKLKDDVLEIAAIKGHTQAALPSTIRTIAETIYRNRALDPQREDFMTALDQNAAIINHFDGEPGKEILYVDDSLVQIRNYKINHPEVKDIALDKLEMKLTTLQQDLEIIILEKLKAGNSNRNEAYYTLQEKLKYIQNDLSLINNYKKIQGEVKAEIKISINDYEQKAKAAKKKLQVEVIDILTKNNLIINNSASPLTDRFESSKKSWDIIDSYKGTKWAEWGDEDQALKILERGLIDAKTNFLETVMETLRKNILKINDPGESLAIRLETIHVSLNLISNYRNVRPLNTENPELDNLEKNLRDSKDFKNELKETLLNINSIIENSDSNPIERLQNIQKSLSLSKRKITWDPVDEEIDNVVDKLRQLSQKPSEDLFRKISEALNQNTSIIRNIHNSHADRLQRTQDSLTLISEYKKVYPTAPFATGPFDSLEEILQSTKEKLAENHAAQPLAAVSQQAPEPKITSEGEKAHTPEVKPSAFFSEHHTRIDRTLGIINADIERVIKKLESLTKNPDPVQIANLDEDKSVLESRIKLLEQLHKQIYRDSKPIGEDNLISPILTNIRKIIENVEEMQKLYPKEQEAQEVRRYR